MGLERWSKKTQSIIRERPYAGQLNLYPVE